jgi:dienelactone hydrolase
MSTPRFFKFAAAALCSLLALLPPGQAQNHEDLTTFADPQTGMQRPIKTKEDWESRRRQVLENLQKVTGPLPVTKVPLALRVLEERIEGGLTRQKVAYHTDSPDKTLSAWLIVPAANPKKLPAVLCLHQTTVVGKDEPVGLAGNPDLKYALELSQRGYVTLSPDYPGLGERKGDLALGSYISTTMRAVFENLRGLDVLSAHPAVDADRIGVIGHSLGGHNSIFTAVFDPRIKVIVSSCGFCPFRSYMGGKLQPWASAYYMPLIAQDYGNDPARVPFDFTELVASLAPRPFFGNAPLHDNNFDAAGVARLFESCGPIYALYGAQDSLQLRQPDAGHQFQPEVREQAYRFIDSRLK